MHASVWIYLYYMEAEMETLHQFTYKKYKRLRFFRIITTPYRKWLANGGIR